MTRAMNRLAAALRAAARRALILAAPDATRTVGRRSLLVVAPHPDDETIGCGGRILLTSRCGGSVTIVVVTDGRGSHSDQDVDPEELRSRRRQELGDATRCLGVRSDSVIALDYPDGEVSEHVAQISAELRTLIDEVRPDDVYVTSEQESHPDHAACARAVAAAVEQVHRRPRVLEYPVWLWADWPVARNRGTTGLRAVVRCLAMRSVERVRIRDLAADKTAALNCYRSQLGEQTITNDRSGYTALPGTAALPTAVVRRALIGPELFFIRATRASRAGTGQADSPVAQAHSGIAPGTN